MRLPSRPGEEAALEGSRCPKCGESFYPPRHVCLNCYHEGLEEVALSTRGELYSFTIARAALPGTLMTPPYVIAQVQLTEGVQVATVLTEINAFFRELHFGRFAEAQMDQAQMQKVYEMAERVINLFEKVKLK